MIQLCLFQGRQVYSAKLIVTLSLVSVWIASSQGSEHRRTQSTNLSALSSSCRSLRSGGPDEHGPEHCRHFLQHGPGIAASEVDFGLGVDSLALSGRQERRLPLAVTAP